MEHIVRILNIEQVTHDVKRFRFEKPDNYTFIPGQATDVSVNKPGLEKELRPFTFTSLNDYPYLEFTIKGYPQHHGITEQIHLLKTGDELIIRDVWGAIEYKGPGYFIAGGAGITPFIAILRQLNKDKEISGNHLFFANKTAADIIYADELSALLGDNLINVLSKQQEEAESGASNIKYHYSRIDEAFLKANIADFGAHFYVCGPDKMITDINEILVTNGAKPDSVVFEK